MEIWEKYFPGFKKEIINAGEVNINTLHGGSGEETILLLHGHPENYLMWWALAPKLSEKYNVVVTDLRGYGESSKPKGLPNHSNYAKRVMAKDQIAVMDYLGIKKFHVAGHDRGARVAHRMLLDYPQRIKSAALLDIIPTYDAYEMTGREFATKYWHWFFYIQPYDFPEVFLGSNPEYFIRSNLLKKAGPAVKTNFPDDIIAEYIRHYSDPATVHAISEDYRAAASIDLEHDAPERERKFDTPLLLLWGANSVVGGLYDVIGVWQKIANNVEGFAVLDCGHFVPEEKPQIVVEALEKFIEQKK